MISYIIYNVYNVALYTICMVCLGNIRESWPPKICQAKGHLCFTLRRRWDTWNFWTKSQIPILFGRNAFTFKVLIIESSDMIQKNNPTPDTFCLALPKLKKTWREHQTWLSHCPHVSSRDEKEMQATSSCLHLLTIKHGTNKWLGRKTTCSALFFTSTSKRIDSPGTAMSIILLVYKFQRPNLLIFQLHPQSPVLFHPVTPQTYQKTGHPPEPEGNEITRPALGACFQELRDGNTLIQSTQTRLDYVHSFNPDERCSGFHRPILEADCNTFWWKSRKRITT